MNDLALQQLIKYAYENVQHYKEMFDEIGISPNDIINKDDLHKLPILTKAQIQKDSQKFLSQEYKHFPKSEEYTITGTSGSTGEILKIYWDKKDLVRSLLHVWFSRKKQYGIDASDKMCTFHSNIYINNKFVENLPESMPLLDGRGISFSKLILDEDHLNKIFEEICDFGPKWMLLQPSVAYLLAEFILDNNLEMPETLKYIELTGEYLLAEYRRKIAEAFKVPIANMYGSVETNSIAIECKNGHMHCLDSNVIIEVNNEGKRAEYGEEGDIFVTGFHNRAMPFIRYSLGDRVVLRPGETCGCGIQRDIIEVKAGRSIDYVKVQGREPINSYLFIYSIESINVRVGYPILQFKIVQETAEEFSMYIVLKKQFEGWKDSISKEFMSEMKKLGLQDYKWKFTFCDKLVANSSMGKLRFFESKLGM